MKPIGSTPPEDRAATTRSILVVDDHPANRKVLEIMLGEETRVVMAEDGQSAVEAARAETFDVILMDMQMPVMDGVRATAQIRSDETVSGRPRVPILMLSAHGEDIHLEMGRNAGADGHLTKPVSMIELLVRVEFLMRRSVS